MSKIVLINCYGLYAPERISDQSQADQDLENIRDYYKKIAGELNEIIDLQAVVLGGGYTNEKVLDKSEAESTLPLFKELLKNKNLPILLETVSQTIVENLVFGYLTIRKFKPKTLIICSDNHRVDKNKKIAQSLFEQTNVKLYFISADRVDPHPDSDYQIQMEKKLPEILASEDFNRLQRLVV